MPGMMRGKNKPMKMMRGGTKKMMRGGSAMTKPVMAAKGKSMRSKKKK